MNWINRIQKCFESHSVFYTRHAKFEMVNEEFGRILDHEVYEAVSGGEVIGEYPEDKPYPSVLIFGRTMTDRPLHIVSAYNDEENLAIIITVYHPDPDLWIDYKRRRS
jgi:hypothetical protein